MKVKYDYQIFASQKFGGISKYFVNLINYIEVHRCFPLIIAPMYINKQLKSDIDKKNKVGIYFNINSKIIIRIFKYLNYLFDFAISIFYNYHITHLTYFSVISNSYIKKNSKLVITIHDMTYEKFPALFKNPQRTIISKKRLIEKADGIITISENTKKDLLSYYKIKSDKIKVIYHGVNLSIFKKNNIKRKLTHNKKFILYVGNRGGYKNFVQLLNVFGQNEEIKRDYDLVIFGGEAISDLEEKKFKKLLVKDKIFQINGNDELLCEYYSQASVFVSTSLYEGFGMTILEAMACECPVIAGNNSSIPEIAGQACCLVDMTKKEDLLIAFNKIIYDHKYRSNLIKLGLSNAKKYKWTDTANQTFNFYKTLI